MKQTNASYSFEDRGTNGQKESISECTLKDLSNDILFTMRENNIPPPLH